MFIIVVYAITYFNPRPSYEERLLDVAGAFQFFDISIHAPHTRSDP